jgi:hypothetical protein
VPFWHAFRAVDGVQATENIRVKPLADRDCVEQNGSRMDKFPIANDFVFEVRPGEAEDLQRLRSQSETLKPGRGQDRKFHVKEDSVPYRAKRKPARS